MTRRPEVSGDDEDDSDAPGDIDPWNRRVSAPMDSKRTFRISSLGVAHPGVFPLAADGHRSVIAATYALAF
jgi:hypothetical protein